MPNRRAAIAVSTVTGVQGGKSIVMEKETPTTTALIEYGILSCFHRAVIS
jgi:hypothetical protein